MSIIANVSIRHNVGITRALQSKHHKKAGTKSIMASTSKSSSEDSDSSDCELAIETETSQTSLLDWQRAPLLSDLMQKRTVRKNPGATPKKQKETFLCLRSQVCYTIQKSLWITLWKSDSFSGEKHFLQASMFCVKVIISEGRCSFGKAWPFSWHTRRKWVSL